MRTEGDCDKRETLQHSIESTEDDPTSLHGVGVWEPAEVKTIMNALQRVSTGARSHTNAPDLVPQEDRAVLLDIGANVGIFSFVAASFGYTVYAFEAMPRNVAALHQTLCWNPELHSTLTVRPPCLCWAVLHISGPELPNAVIPL